MTSSHEVRVSNPLRSILESMKQPGTGAGLSLLGATGCHRATTKRGAMAKLDGAPKQFCLECGFELEHEDTNTAATGQEGELERFDYYKCPNGHGKFQYHHAEKILRKLIG